MALLSPLTLNAQNHNSFLSKPYLPSLSSRATTRIPLHIKRRSLPLFRTQCSAKGGDELRSGSTASVKPQPLIIKSDEVKRSDFPPPPQFLFGAATAAYQIEGAWDQDGRGPSIWDHFTQNHEDKISDKSTGNVALDHYNNYKDDIKIMKEMGFETYRFSISWSRILPEGTIEGGINPAGVAFYNNVINELLANGITPFVTLFHWDAPLALEKKYNGFRDKRIVKDFVDFAKICFIEFGGRVKNWSTINEPWSFATHGYSLGWHAPSRGVEGVEFGNPLTEPYIVTHNLILAHAAVVQLYRDHFQAIQRGQIGIVINSIFFKEYSDSEADKKAAKRGNDFVLGWYMDPFVHGDYPKTMKDILGDRLPRFTEEEKKAIKGSYDYFGINYYTSSYAKDKPTSGQDFTYFDDMQISQETKNIFGEPIGELHGSWIYVHPEGIRELLIYIKENYNNPNIYITENGTAEIDNPEISKEEALKDEKRIEYLQSHIQNVHLATLVDNVNVKGYYVWSLADNFEWQKGYTERFGLVYIDYADGLKRMPKKSAGWYTNFLKS
ncbi:beta-glucosidase 24-like [Asparagus officinalis]|uniref:beta-glucosidase 24-like n=1 Tax=Asparagus officinalis TaxID=4686 RepID=UPI00098E3272|nr:beta-glucosidase 24-like [Asparagus officinalis]